jgi:hypothetical protein
MLAVFAVNVAASGGLMTMFPVVTTENQVRVRRFAGAEAALVVLDAAAERSSLRSLLSTLGLSLFLCSTYHTAAATIACRTRSGRYFQLRTFGCSGSHRSKAHEPPNGSAASSTTLTCSLLLLLLYATTTTTAAVDACTCGGACHGPRLPHARCGHRFQGSYAVQDDDKKLLPGG